jgi:hypothetical protein
VRWSGSSLKSKKMSRRDRATTGRLLENVAPILLSGKHLRETRLIGWAISIDNQIGAIHDPKLLGRRIEQEDTMLDYIWGHAPATVGRGYGEPTLKDLARVIQRFPRYDTDGHARPPTGNRAPRG